MGCTRLATFPGGRMIVTAALLFSVVGMAAVAAQPDRGTPPPPPVLRGPAVQETGIPGTERAFSMEDGARGPQARMLNREIPMNEFMGAFRALNGPETPDDLHLSADQREALGAIVRDHAQALREHMQAHREEISQLGQTLGFDPMEIQRGEQAMGDRVADGERRARRAVGEDAAPGAPRGQAGGPAGARRGATEGDAAPARAPRSPEQVIRERVGTNPTPEQRTALERLREIRESGPDGLEAQTRAWNLLSAPQQEFVQARLDEGRARQQAQRGEMYVEEMVQRGGLGAGADAPGRRVPPGAAPGGPPGAAAERLHRLIDELSPQEQEMLLRLIENRLEQRRAGQGPARTDGVNRRPPPPPTMDEIRVPSPGPV